MTRIRLFSIDRPFWVASDNSALPWASNGHSLGAENERFGLRFTVFNDISAISWRSVLLVVETGENHRPVASHCQTLSHNIVSSTPRLSRVKNSQR